MLKSTRDETGHVMACFDPPPTSIADARPVLQRICSDKTSGGDSKLQSSMSAAHLGSVQQTDD